MGNPLLDEQGQPRMVQIDCGFNFWGQVTEEQTHDDGVETRKVFHLVGGMRDKNGDLVGFPELMLPAEKFEGLRWVTEQWGMRARIKPEVKPAEAAYILKYVSAAARRRTIYAHTGWREIGGRWLFLTPAGALGVAAGEETVDIILADAGLSRYRLPLVPEDAREAMRRSLDTLALAPANLSVPLFAATYRAVLSEGLPSDLSVNLVGGTGLFKTALATLYLSHFGDFDYTHVPTGWSSTANYLEKLASLAKDLLLLIDDYVPRPGLDLRELRLKAERVLRSQGNVTGRGRMRADTTLRPSYVPRGLVLSTGETALEGESLVARVVNLEVTPGAVDLQTLIAAETWKTRLPHAMAGYLLWLAPQMAGLRETLRARWQTLRSEAATAGEHPRVPSALAHLYLGFEMALTYARAIGACDEAERKTLCDQAWATLDALGAVQARTQAAQNPLRRFLTVLMSLQRQDRVRLADADGEPHRQKGQHIPGVPIPPGTFVGWYDEDYYYLDPEAAVEEVVKACRAADELFPAKKADVIKAAIDRGLAVKGQEGTEERRLSQEWLPRKSGQRVRVLKLVRARVDVLLGDSLL